MENSSFLPAVKSEFLKLKTLGETAMNQLEAEQLFFRQHAATNSIAIIVQHMSGNMLSRWTEFLTTDGEKDWRNRDAEFEPVLKDKNEVMTAWQNGWTCLLNALETLTTNELEKIVFIRHEPHTVTQAIIRQLPHYASHVGQIILIAKTIKGENFESLSIKKGSSTAFNQEKFGSAQ